MIKNLLVVCSGNMYRSPIAEALLRIALPQCRVQSAGVHAAVGLPPPSALKTWFEARRLVRSSWSPWQIGLSDVARADLLLVMETAHKREVERSFPSCAGKTFLLGEPLGRDIPDPRGGGHEILDRCYAQIELCARAWARRILAVNEAGSHG
jgi:protein-tyrosine phosphatase